MDIEETIEFSPSSTVHDLINFDIFEDIAKARALLENRTCEFNVVMVRSVTKIKKEKKVKNEKKGKKGKGRKGAKKGAKIITKQRLELGEFSILLAVENVKTREIHVVKVHPKLGARSEGIVIEPGKSNGVNTKFTIVYPDHSIVLALKRPVRHGDGFKEVVYTPYSEGLDLPEVTNAGAEYLRNILRAAKNDLAGRGVRPLSGNAFISDDVAFALAIIEHIDPMKFESGRYTPEQLIHETLVIMGANREAAYRYSLSKAGARGLFQFIPDTYKRIVRLYPHAGLRKDFAQGMEDHENAGKASFLLFDADLRVLVNGSKETLLNDPRSLGKFLASAYNCGSGKTKGAVDRHGRNWCAAVPQETQIYLKKYDAVWEWLQRRPQPVR